ncbi:MAG: hypothetical protein D6800_14660 [Candidatus Zixiibacteriota bacterium]|nr:MAG: hypothetical protein D6800_14660 [candidate division Zixibacteria bacterium]
MVDIGVALGLCLVKDRHAKDGTVWLAGDRLDNGFEDGRGQSVVRRVPADRKIGRVIGWSDFWCGRRQKIRYRGDETIETARTGDGRQVAERNPRGKRTGRESIVE